MQATRLTALTLVLALGAGAAIAQGARGELFATYDSDGDGRLTQEELTAGRTAQFTQFDANGDGSLSIDEYEALWLAAMRERMVDRFQDHDDDGNGAVTAEEFSEEFSGLVARMDRNGDGAISSEDRMARRGDDDDRMGREMRRGDDDHGGRMRRSHDD